LAQWRVLVVLGDAADDATISQVSRRIGVTLPATSRQLRRLARRGLVEIGPDEGDRRAMRVRLTGLGHTARQDVVAFRKKELAKVAATLRLDKVTANQFARIATAMDRAD
jgi:DNA-binding MarR family transcriptional regulator